METQEWWKEDFEKKHWGAMFECGDYETLLDDVSAIITEAVRRRDAELLEKVEGMKENDKHDVHKDMFENYICTKCGEADDFLSEKCESQKNWVLERVIKLIKGE